MGKLKCLCFLTKLRILKINLRCQHGSKPTYWDGFQQRFGNDESNESWPKFKTYHQERIERTESFRETYHEPQFKPSQFVDVTCWRRCKGRTWPLCLGYW